MKWSSDWTMWKTLTFSNNLLFHFMDITLFWSHCRILKKKNTMPTDVGHSTSAHFTNFLIITSANSDHYTDSWPLSFPIPRPNQSYKTSQIMPFFPHLNLLWQFSPEYPGWQTQLYEFPEASHLPRLRQGFGSQIKAVVVKLIHNSANSW